MASKGFPTIANSTFTDVTQKKERSVSMIYEIRTYTLTPGSIPEFEKRFEKSLTNRLKYSELDAFWHTDIGPLNQVIHVWPYENLEHRAETRQRAVQEPDWPPNTGEFIVSMQSEIFKPASFSPKLGGAGRSWAISMKCGCTSINPDPLKR